VTPDQLTTPQLLQLVRLGKLERGQWATARTHGERVTLASLHGRELAKRVERPRAGRQTFTAREGRADGAYAYRLTAAGQRALDVALGAS
jgi:hypothetical protein